MKEKYESIHSFTPKDYKKLENAFEAIVDKTKISPSEVLEKEFIN